MGYLERNAAIVGEVKENFLSRKVSLHRKWTPVVNDRRTTIFEPIGSVRSGILDSDLHLGVKKYHSSRGEFADGQYRTRFIADLSRIRSIADNIPTLAPEVPKVFALTVNETGIATGILTEDFSEGGMQRVESVTERRGRAGGMLPVELKTLIPGVDEEGLAGAIFLVGKEGLRKIGDFDELLVRMSIRQRREIFPSDEIYDRIQEFTIFVPGESIQ